MAGFTLLAACVLAAQGVSDARDVSCSSALTARFAPADPDGLRRYEVCRSTRPSTELAQADWTTEPLPAGEAFAAAPPPVRRALVRLYGGRRVDVTRGWRRPAAGTGVESVTLFSPAPDDAVTRLVPGTLILTSRFHAAGGQPRRAPEPPSSPGL